MSKPKLDKYTIKYDDASYRMESFNMRALECGRISTDTNESYGEHFSHLFRINYILEGIAYYRYEDRMIELDPGTVIFLEPNVTLSVEEGKPVKILFINFDVNAIDKVEEFLNLMERLFPLRHIHDKNDEIKNLMQLIFELSEKNEIGSGLEIQNYFENLIIKIIRRSGKHHQELVYKPSNRADDLYIDAVKYINAHIGETVKMSDLSEYLGISSNYLYKIFMSHTGKSPSDFTTDVKISFAKRQLANPNIQIKLIANNLGYDSVAHFSRTFKKCTGESPAVYRKRAISEMTQKIELEALLHEIM